MKEPKSTIVKHPGKFYSPLRYPGGKASLASFLFNIIENNHITNCTYIEPFAGGAGAAFTLLFLEKVDSIVINDFDKHIFSFWDAILNYTEKFIDKIHATEITIDEWHIQKKIYTSNTSSSFELGFAAFFLNRTNHSGIIEARPIGGFDQKGKWGIDARFNKKNLIDRIKRIALYKSRIQLSNIDGIELMKGTYKSPNTLFYIDPPYFVKGSSLYLNHYSHKDHKRLADFLNGKPNFNWLLTYDNVKPIWELYYKRIKIEFNLNYHINQPKKGKEILFISDTLDCIDYLEEIA